MELQQSRFEVVDAYIKRADNSQPVTGLTTADFAFRMKKKGETSFSTKTFYNQTGELGQDLDIDDTVVYFDNTDDLDKFPMSGKLWIDKGGGSEEGPLSFTRIAGLSYVTLDTGVASTHLATEVITLDDFWEVGVGIYSVLLNKTDTNTLGEFVYVFDPTSTDYENFVQFAEVVAATSPGVAPDEISLSNCIIYGYIHNVDGQPMQNISVSFRIIGEPETLSSSNVGLSHDPFQVLTDADGYFAAAVVRDVDLDVVIPEIFYRKVVTVPDADSAELFSL